MIDAKDDISGDGYLVEPIVVQDWIDQNMYSPPAATNLPPAWNVYWSGWLSLHKGTFTQRTPDGLSAANLSPNAHQVDIVTTTSGSTPAVIRYPR